MLTVLLISATSSIESDCGWTFSFHLGSSYSWRNSKFNRGFQSGYVFFRSCSFVIRLGSFRVHSPHLRDHGKSVTLRDRCNFITFERSRLL